MLNDRELREELHALSSQGVGDAYVSALLTFGGALGKDEKGLYLAYTSHDYLNAWELGEYLRDRYGYHAEVRIVDPDDKRRSRLYALDVRGRCARELLSDLGKIKVAQEEIVSMDLGVKCRVSSAKETQEYARGVYLSTGRITRAAEGLRLEMTFELESDAEAFLAILQREGIAMSKAKKADKYTIGTRKGQTISDFCALMGANKSVFVLQDMIIQKYMDSQTARAGNLMLANTDKSVSAAIGQYNDAVMLRDGTGGFIGVPREIREVAEARIECPNVSIEELAPMLSDRITKSGLYHRLQKMHELAERLRRERE